ncbi:hypothetical protein HBI56_023900 [Parastagonospora nodorum]|uniref:Uncharacterized protein n=1 Tax=Phaeosphaeria nodorum (strain SN15 / ATCC MYA-4574 / FGSC 10173) TaxID=321614 RepID=A0A7U2F973_PHANO|nr:hypothetical protein HBH56_024620 [Parastagonospora nodorum]QRC98810.1 hypothetical protein JI435_412590 [Parastagonospora nodorum SN15]KAH3934150.1 hypothetical protein HBH54_057400 [Parastagonospora nodorum]KAH3975759.1 hypothetical protein HBH51_080280 [Parastagonospora nodorum]KAH3984931.1 hypothetical protein HBH52_056200 [Parastagonospora nodorum]
MGMSEPGGDFCMLIDLPDMPSPKSQHPMSMVSEPHTPVPHRGTRGEMLLLHVRCT